jgi:hypothetical protein
VPVHDLAGDRANGQAGPNGNPKTDNGTREGCVTYRDDDRDRQYQPDDDAHADTVRPCGQ